MIVGNHPHSRDGALTQLREKGAHGDPALGRGLMRYWRELYRLLDDAGIDRHAIFATNIHPAYFTRTSGRVPRRGNDPWFRHARELLLDQVHTMRPRLLVAFGGAAIDELNRVGLDVPPLELNQPRAPGHRRDADDGPARAPSLRSGNDTRHADGSRGRVPGCLGGRTASVTIQPASGRACRNVPLAAHPGPLVTAARSTQPGPWQVRGRSVSQEPLALPPWSSR